MLKVCNGGPRRYKFVLFSDMLVYGTETMRAKIQRDHRKYKVLLILGLPRATAVSIVTLVFLVQSVPAGSLLRYPGARP